MNRLIWITQLFALCLAKVPASPDVSCPCRFYDECPRSFRIDVGRARASELACENRYFVRCCLDEEHQSKHVDNLWPADESAKYADKDGYKTVYDLVRKRISALIDGDEAKLDEHLGEVSLESLPTNHHGGPETSDQLGLNVFEDVERSLAMMRLQQSIDNNPMKYRSTRIRNPSENTLQDSLPTTRPLRVLVLDRLPIFLPVDQSPRVLADRKPAEKVNYPVRPKYAENVKETRDFRREIEDTIGFESLRVTSQQKRPAENNNGEQWGRTNEHNFNQPANPSGDRLDSAKSVAGNFSKRVTSLDPRGTADRISVQAANENASTSRPVDRMFNIPEDDALNALLSASSRCVKRLVRSDNERIADSRNETAEAEESSVEKKPAWLKNETVDRGASGLKERTRIPQRRFKRPLRVLSIGVKKGRLEVTQDQKRRTLDLIARSNEKTRNRATSIINRNNVKIHRIPFVNNSNVSVREGNSTRVRAKPETTVEEANPNDLSEITAVTVSGEEERDSVAARNR